MKIIFTLLQNATTMVKFFEALWRVIATDQGKLIAGFILTTVIGSALGFLLQRVSWRRQAKTELFRQRYLDGTKLLEELSNLIDRRYFRLQRLLWAIPSKGGEEIIKLREKEYFETVQEWNEKLRSIHNRIRLLVGDAEALQFLDYKDDFQQNSPKSLHYRFVHAHREVLKSKANLEYIPTAQEEVNRLNWALSRFAYETTTLFMSRASSLTLLRSTTDQSQDNVSRHTSGPDVLQHPGDQTGKT